MQLTSSQASANQSLPTELLEPSRFTIIRRIANLGLLVAAVLISLNLWIYSAEQDQRLRQTQVDQLGQTLLELQAPLVSEALAQEQRELLASMIQYLAADPKVISAAVYGDNSHIISASEQHQPLIQLYRNGGNNPLVYVRKLSRGEETLGYLRIILDTQQVLRHHEAYQESVNKQFQVIFLMAVALGFIVARAYYKFRYRHIALRRQKREQQTD